MMIDLQLETQHIKQAVFDAFVQFKAAQPLVHYITNSVAANYAANVLLAAGASPALIDNPFEAAQFAQIASSVSINTGTPNTEQVQAMKLAAQSATTQQKPWVIDPVGYGQILTWRSQVVDELLAFHPSIIRGNASEISALVGHQTQSRGVDSTLHSADVYQQAQLLFIHTECVAISGESDFIVAKNLPYAIQVNGGSHLQPRVTATGCALGALIAAYAAVSSPTIASVCAHVHFAIAGQLAYLKAPSVGHFNVAFLDEIEQLNLEKLQQHINIQLCLLTT